MNKASWAKYKAFLEKLGKETVYFKNSFEYAVIKSEPKVGYLVKIGRRPAFIANPESKLIADAILEYQEITQAEYERF